MGRKVVQALPQGRLQQRAGQASRLGSTVRARTVQASAIQTNPVQPQAVLTHAQGAQQPHRRRVAQQPLQNVLPVCALPPSRSGGGQQGQPVEVASGLAHQSVGLLCRNAELGHQVAPRLGGGGRGQPDAVTGQVWRQRCLIFGGKQHVQPFRGAAVEVLGGPGG